MKKILLASFLLTIGVVTRSFAQTTFNHTTIYVTNLEKSVQFYKEVLHLPQIDDPFHDGRHVWFRIGSHAQLHVVKGAKEIIPHDVNIHLAFSVPSVDAFARRLDSLHIAYGNFAHTPRVIQSRHDGIKQIYLQDPEGYWIEINDDRF